MKKKLLLILLVLLVLPLTVRALEEPNVNSLDAHAEDNGNIILFGGTTVNNAHAVMCKLFKNNEEIDKLSVEVTNEGSNGTFGGSFLAPSTGTYTVSCANYEGGTIESDDVTVSTMTKIHVSFYDPEFDVEIDNVEVDAGTTVARPNQDPTKEGKVFGGWYEDNTFTTPFDFSTRITAFVTIYVKWNDEEVPTQNQTRVQVIYSGGGTYQVDFATDDPQNQGPMNALIDHSASYFVDPDTQVTLTAVPGEGQHLAGWFATHEDEDPNNPGQMIWVEDEMLSNQTEYVFTPTGENFNVKLVFEENETYEVTFNTNGGTEISPVNVEAGHTVARPNPDPSKNGEVFEGWYADDTFTTEFNFNTPITADTVIYAKFVIKHTVTFNTNGGSAIASVEVTEGEPVARPTNDPTKDDKIFGGWYDNENLEHEYDFNNPINGGTTIYAKWVQVYNPDDENHLNDVTFIGEENQQGLHLVITDLSNLPDEALAAMNPPMTREEYEAVIESLTYEAKQLGTLISFLDISVIDNNGDTVDVDDELTIRLALTDEMGDYKYYKLVYLEQDNNGNIVLGRAYDLSKEGQKLVGSLDHLSAYVLIGSNTDNSSSSGSGAAAGTGTSSSTSSNSSKSTTATGKNPLTVDNIYIMFIVFGVSLIGILFGAFRYLKVKKVK